MNTRDEKVTEVNDSKSRWEGLIAAAYAPLDEYGGINLQVVPRYVSHLEASGCSGVFVNGTTGESLSLSVEERKQLASEWCRFTRSKRLSVIVHVGHNSLPEAMEMAIHAEEVGADGIGLMPPSYFKPGTVEDLVYFCRKVAEQAPSLPFYYYHIPDLTGVSLPMMEFLEMASAEIPTLGGIKYTHSDLAEFLQCLNFAGRSQTIFFGRDEALLAALVLGATSAVGSTYNCAAPIYKSIIAAFQRGDLVSARQEQLFITELVSVLKRPGFLPASKALMSMLGLDLGPVRSPLRELTAGEKESLRRELLRIGFFEKID